MKRKCTGGGHAFKILLSSFLSQNKQIFFIQLDELGYSWQRIPPPPEMELVMKDPSSELTKKITPPPLAKIKMELLMVE